MAREIVKETLTASGQSTSWLTVRSFTGETAKVGVLVSGFNGHVVAVEVKRLNEADGSAKPISNPPAEADPYRIVEVVGDLDIRVTWASGGTGNIEVEMTV